VFVFKQRASFLKKKAKESMTTFADNVNVSKLQMERAKVMLDVGSMLKIHRNSISLPLNNLMQYKPASSL